MQFIQARNYTRGPRRGPIELVVLHTMEASERPDTAEAVARWFATTDRQASAHYCVDADSIVRCVRDDDIAWAAPGANHNGLQIELAGRAAQSSREWDDAYSRALLRRAADLVADLCVKYGIPAVLLGPGELLDGSRGITTHAAVSEAFKRSNHWDPGRNFPHVLFLGLVRAAMDTATALRRRRGYYAWLAWYEGHDEWREFGKRNSRVRPNVPKRVVPLWWARRVLFLRRQKGAA